MMSPGTRHYRAAAARYAEKTAAASAAVSLGARLFPTFLRAGAKSGTKGLLSKGLSATGRGIAATGRGVARGAVLGGRGLAAGFRGLRGLAARGPKLPGSQGYNRQVANAYKQRLRNEFLEAGVGPSARGAAAGSPQRAAYDAARQKARSYHPQDLVGQLARPVDEFAFDAALTVPGVAFLGSGSDVEARDVMRRRPLRRVR